MSEFAIQTTHRLGFYSKPWKRAPEWNVFQIGTCNGLWRDGGDAFEILALYNEFPGNGHLEDVFEWFEYSCRQNSRALRIRERMNTRFAEHLVRVRGFKHEQADDYIKYFL